MAPEKLKSIFVKRLQIYPYLMSPLTRTPVPQSTLCPVIYDPAFVFHEIAGVCYRPVKDIVVPQIISIGSQAAPNCLLCHFASMSTKYVLVQFVPLNVHVCVALLVLFQLSTDQSHQRRRCGTSLFEPSDGALIV